MSFWFSGRGLLVLLLIVSAFVFGYLLGQGEPPAQIPRPTQVVQRYLQEKPEKPGTPLYELLEPALKNQAELDKASSKKSASSVLEICQSDWENLSNLSVDELLDTLVYREPLISKACAQKMKEKFESIVVQNYLESCQETLETLSNDEIYNRCEPTLVDFRSFVIRELHRHTEISEEQSLSSLNTQLYGGMLDLTELGLRDVRRNIQLAEAITSQDPDNYWAYKSQLTNLLLLEAKFGETVDPEVYEELYDELLEFEGPANEQEILLESRILRDEEIQEAPELVSIDKDLIHIPFLRMAALNDLESLREMSLDYIETYPSSHIGYLYLAESLWRQGREAEAVNALSEVTENSEQEQMLLQLFAQFQMEPMGRIYQLSYSQ